MQNENNNSKKHIKLEDIQKKNVYVVPDGYFEKLPRQIQTRIAARNKTWNWDWALLTERRMAWVAVVALIIVSGSIFIALHNNDVSKQLTNRVVIPKVKLQEVKPSARQLLKLETQLDSKNELAITPTAKLQNVPQPLETLAKQIKDSTTTEPIAVLKIDAATLIASLNKQEISNYLNTENSEEYEWEEVSAKL